MNPFKSIPGAELVTNIFGDWPTFQNAETQWVRIHNEEVGGVMTPTIELVIRYWEMNKDISSRGYYLHKHDCLIHFVFHDVYNVHLYDFNHRNVVFRMSIISLSEPQSKTKYKVEIKSSVGFGASFNCQSAKVLSVETCDEEHDCAGMTQNASTSPLFLPF